MMLKKKKKITACQTRKKYQDHSTMALFYSWKSQAQGNRGLLSNLSHSKGQGLAQHPPIASTLSGTSNYENEPHSH